MAGRYAIALFDLAEDAKALEAVSGDLDNLIAMLDDSGDLSRALSSPVVSRAEQAKVAEGLAAKAEMHDLTKNFLGVLARNRRLAAVRDVGVAFRRLLAHDRGEMSADVTAAHELTATQTQALADKLEGIFRQKMTINTKVDPSILGGLIVQVGSRMMDASLRTKLDKLKVAMKGVG